MTPAGTQLPVVVLYRGGNGALAVARTLGRLGVDCFLVTQAGTRTPVTSSRFWRETVEWDFARPEADSVAFLTEYARTVSAEGAGRPLLLTLADWAAVFIERNAAALAEAFVFPRTPEPVIERLAHKATMGALAVQHGIPTPRTAAPATEAEALAFADGVGFPLVLKPSDSFAARVPEKRVVRSREELVGAVRQELRFGPLNFVLQEYVPGGADSVWMCNAYFDRDGRCRAIYTGQKLRQVSSTGVASLAVCVPNDDVRRQTEAFMTAVGYRGCVGIGWRFDSRDGTYKVLDVNPRVSGVFRLFAGTNELDVVRACHRDFSGQDIPASVLQPGRKWMLEDDFRVAWRAVRAGELGLRAWASSLRGLRESQWFALDDPRPFVRWLRSGFFGAR